MPPQPTLIYHITHKDNLSGIIKHGAIVAQSQLGTHQTNYCNIAHNTIQDRRSITPVPCGPGRSLHDYVPFYFAPRSPMLYAIHMGNVDECTAGQKDIVYLVSSTHRVDEEGCKYVFTDGHGIMAFSDFYDNLNDLGAIDWDIMVAKYWRDTSDDPDRKRRRQAEFLVYLQFPWNLVEEIGVINRNVESGVNSIVSKASYKPPVTIRGDWYY